jgi:hypothetical protein
MRRSGKKAGSLLVPTVRHQASNYSALPVAGHLQRLNRLRLLTSGQDGFAGTLQVDGYAGYNEVFQVAR